MQKLKAKNMEKLDVFDCSNVFIGCHFTDERRCAHENKEHTLIYQCSDELEIEERGKKTVLHPGECAFMRRDNRMWLQKKVEGFKNLSHFSKIYKEAYGVAPSRQDELFSEFI